MATAFSEQLVRINACVEARAWVGQRLPHEAWRDCERPDWMLWLAERIGVPRTQLVLAACACARTALQYVPAGEKRPLRAIEAAERWAKEPTEANLVAARAAARDSAYARSAAAASAADNAANAAYAAAYDAAYAAAAATYAADAATYARSGAGASKQMCAEIRAIIKVTYRKAASR